MRPSSRLFLIIAMSMMLWWSLGCAANRRATSTSMRIESTPSSSAEVRAHPMAPDAGDLV